MFSRISKAAAFLAVIGINSPAFAAEGSPDFLIVTSMWRWWLAGGIALLVFMLTFVNKHRPEKEAPKWMAACVGGGWLASYLIALFAPVWPFAIPAVGGAIGVGIHKWGKTSKAKPNKKEAVSKKEKKKPVGKRHGASKKQKKELTANTTVCIHEGCNHANPTNSRFCSGCGKALQAIQPTNQQQQPTIQAQQPRDRYRRRR